MKNTRRSFKRLLHECEAPINIHRVKYDAKTITLCYQCQFDLRDGSLDDHSADIGSQLHYQLKLLKAINRGWFFYLTKSRLICICTNALHQIFHPLLSQNSKLLLHLRDQTKEPRLNSCTAIRKKAFEEMNVITRFHLIKLANWLLSDWPHRFISFSKSVELRSADLQRGMKYIPYWFGKIVLGTI